MSDFDNFRGQFEFTDAAAPVMAEYGKLRRAHEPAAEKLWSQARASFQAGNKEEGYRLCQEIIGKYGASSCYYFAKQTLDGRK